MDKGHLKRFIATTLRLYQHDLDAYVCKQIIIS